MKKLRLFFLAFILLALILQTTVVDFFRVYSIKPDLVLLVVIFLGFMYGKRDGMLAGFLGGLFSDLAAGSYIGLNIVSYLAAGYLAGMGENNFYKDNVFVASVICVIGTLLSQLVYYLLLLFLIVDVPVLHGIKIIVGVALYNGFLTLILYRWFYMFFISKGYLKDVDV